MSSKFFKNSMMASPKRISFLATYRHHQAWTLPDSIVYYISKNPTAKAYEKMIQSCKYFFIKNPILVIHRLSLFCLFDVWHTNFNVKQTNLSNGLSKIWITDILCISNNFYCNDLFVLSPIFQKIYQSDIKVFTLSNQDISFKEFIFLALKCEEIIVRNATIKDENGENVVLESIVTSVPHVKTFRYNIGEKAQNIITPDTVSELLKISHFSNQNRFTLTKISETFDIETFYVYLKKNIKTKIYLHFCHQVSHEYKARLQRIIDEIISTENRGYKVPFIDFYGSVQSSSNTLWKLHMEK